MRSMDGWSGEALARLGREEPARGRLRRVLSGHLTVRPARRAHAARGRLAMRARPPSEAVRELRKAVEACPHERMIAADLGRALLSAGGKRRLALAHSTCQELIEAGPRARPSDADLVIVQPPPALKLSGRGPARAALTDSRWQGQVCARLAGGPGRGSNRQGQEAATLAAEALAGQS